MLGRARTWGVVYFCAAVIGCSGSTFSSSGSGGTDAGGGSGGSTGGSAGTPSTGGSAGTPATGGGAGTPASGGSGGTAASGGSGGTAAAGGSAGTGGGGAVGGSGGGPGAAPQCSSISDCSLQSDCCNCTALLNGETAPPCNVTYALKKCPATTQLRCSFGQCTTDLICDASKVSTICSTTHPACPSGQINSVNPATQCWGPCVDPSDCVTVSDCSLCNQNQVCVDYYDTGSLARRRCVDVPTSCQGHPDCSCMASGMCAGSNTSCSSNSTGLRCDFSG